MLEILCADAELILPTLDDTFDAMLTDPPYAPRVHAKAITQIAGGGQKRDLEFEPLTPQLRDCIASFGARQVRGWSLVYSDLQGTGAWHEAFEVAGAEHIRDVPWIRWSMPQLSADRPPSGAEMTCWFHPRGKKQWQGPGNLTHLDHSDRGALEAYVAAWRTQHGADASEIDLLVDALSVLPALDHSCLRKSNKAFHPTEKPLSQALDLVSWLTKPGDLVIDPCAGASTIGVACRYLGRRYVGLERRADWAELARVRLAQESPLDAKKYAAWVKGLAP